MLLQQLFSYIQNISRFQLQFFSLNPKYEEIQWLIYFKNVRWPVLKTVEFKDFLYLYQVEKDFLVLKLKNWKKLFKSCMLYNRNAKKKILWIHGGISETKYFIFNDWKLGF